MTDTDTQAQERVLGVFAHPDDETLGAGALLALASRAGHDVSVVTCTRGERGEVIPADLAHLRGDGAALAAHRESELSEALAALGVGRHLFLDQVPALAHARPARFRDSGMAWVAPGIAGPAPDSGPEAFSRLDVDVAATLLAVVIRHLRPTTVLTEEPGGGYGHPDHVQASRVTMRALELAAATSHGAGGDDPLAGLAPWTVPAVAWVAQAEPDMRAAAEELVVRARREGPPRGADGGALTLPTAFSAPDAALPPLLVPPTQIDATLDARGVLPAVAQAMRAHRSQVQAVALVEPRAVTASRAAPADRAASAGHVASGPGAASDSRALLAGHFALSNGTVLPLLARAYLRLAPGYGPLPATWAGLAAANPPRPHDPDRGDGGRAHAHDHAGVGERQGELLHDHAGVGEGQGELLHDHAGVGEGQGELLHDHAGVGAGAGVVEGGAERVPAFDDVVHGGPRRVQAAPVVRARPRTRPNTVNSALPYTVPVAIILGVVVAALGTVVHRWQQAGQPAGMVLALVAVLAAAVTARALAGAGGLLVMTLAVVVVTQAMTFVRPGGDVLVTGEALSYTWIFGAPLLCIVAALLPGRWFANARPPSARRTADEAHDD